LKLASIQSKPNNDVKGDFRMKLTKLLSSSIFSSVILASRAAVAQSGTYNTTYDMKGEFTLNNHGMQALPQLSM